MKSKTSFEKLNAILMNLSVHDRVRFVEQLEDNPKLFKAVMNNIDAKLEKSDSEIDINHILQQEEEALKDLLNQE